VPHPRLAPPRATRDAQARLAATRIPAARIPAARAASVCAVFALALAACSEATAPAVAPAPVEAMLVAGGDAQRAPLGTAFADSLRVRVLGAGGTPLAGREVRFTVTAGPGTVAPAVDTTDQDGLASAWLAATDVGEVRVRAEAAPGAARDLTATVTEPDSTAAPTVYNPDWTLATHGIVAPDYPTVFRQDSVRAITIELTAAQWSAIRADLTAILGYDLGGRPGSAGVLPSRDPAYVAARVRSAGKQWKKVGFRLKGNSSLGAAWGDGNLKLPFRLKFNEFQATYPAITGQRFHGFKELSFSPGYRDQSLVREKVAADLFRLAGVPAARTAFYRVYIDYGTGPLYAGVYTAVEVIDDTMVRDQFGDDAGNLYKPESALGTFSAAEFEKKNNRTANDFSDVQAFVAALNAGTRVTAPASWRAALEATFDVDHFLRWLAVSNTMVNWDSYGTQAQNYYLYHHPVRGLVWIPWDHNEAMIGAPGVTGVPNTRNGLSLSMNEVGSAWPLIRYLADDPVYAARYRTHLRGIRDSVFTEAAMDAMLDRATALVTPFAIGPAGERAGSTYLTGAASFASANGQLKAHVRARRALVGTFVP